MKIYLKGYYGYQNFGDELLLFGVIEEIFSRYLVEDLVIEVGDNKWIKKRISKNQKFLNLYYKQRNIKIDWRKIRFFSPKEYFGKQNFFGFNIPNRRKSYLSILLGKHPYQNYFKIFGGGEVIDEDRTFPHNGRNILLLYTKTILKKNFALRGGLGSQKNFFIKELTKFLVRSAESLVLREEHSFKICQDILGKHQKKTELFHDFSKNIIKFGNKKNNEKRNGVALINISPSFDYKKWNNIQKNIFFGSDLIIFPCDLNFDLLSITNILGKTKYKIFYRTQYDLVAIFGLLNQAQIGIGSRLHFLYTLKHLNKKIINIGKNSKLTYNL